MTFVGVFVISLLRMRRNTINSTSCFKMDFKFEFPVPKNIYTREIRPSNCILMAFFDVFRDFLLRMRRNTINSTSCFKMDLKFEFLVPKNIYREKIRPSNCILMAFFDVFRDFFYCACAETPVILLPVSKWTSNSAFPYRKTYTCGKSGLQTAF